ncbi:MAG: hypothetical protein PHW18_08650 [Sulfuricurvum sp.]|uniref:hypothetical protein n=1 Tax=Sulfuricurvum sp. TaxID=2025608 RepID=UPI00260519B3|nr:hypothetical protein [Sulfuricurvum sp.]MDD2829626.1 hypothetical protein [Sulfuricurvum sp.]MDD4950558.1 hypothetical protein [Sulfuricurvum sp.]
MEYSFKYVGPKPLISKTGIDFDQNKEDKFVFMSIVAELIQALDHEYITDKNYVCNTGDRPLNSDAILGLIRKYNPNLTLEIEERKKLTEKAITDELDRANHNKLLCAEECQILVKNIELMRSYNIQRSINKSIYYSGINILAEIIKRGHIDTIISPMFLKFNHVFHSVQGVLVKLHPPIDSTIDIYEDSGHLKTKFTILHKV